MRTAWSNAKRSRKPWTLDDDAFLLAYEGFEAHLIADDLERTKAAIYTRWSYLRSDAGQKRREAVLLHMEVDAEGEDAA